MSSERNDNDPDRRDVLRAAGAAMLGGLVLAAATPADAQTRAAAGATSRNNRPLGARLQGVQHFGLTVQNMERAYSFYTEVLGGTEVMRDGDFHGDPRARIIVFCDIDELGEAVGVFWIQARNRGLWNIAGRATSGVSRSRNLSRALPPQRSKACRDQKKSQQCFATNQAGAGVPGRHDPVNL